MNGMAGKHYRLISGIIVDEVPLTRLFAVRLFRVFGGYTDKT